MSSHKIFLCLTILTAFTFHWQNAYSDQYSVGGSVTGLSGSGLIIQNNGANDLPISGPSFIFGKKYASGSTYNIKISSQPTEPSQTCKIESGGQGTIESKDINNVLLTCTTNSYSIGGIISNLVGSGLELKNNDTNALSINGKSFIFPNKILSGQDYKVTVATQPSNPNQECIVTHGVGSVSSRDISNISIICGDTVTSSKTIVPHANLADGSESNNKPNHIISGQSVLWKVTVRGFRLYNQNQGAQTTYQSPPGAVAEVTSIKDGNLILNFSHDSWSIWRPFDSLFYKNQYLKGKYSNANCGDNCVTKKDTYIIGRNVAEGYDHAVDGHVAGILVVPFKYHLSDSTTTGGSTIGGYIGHRWGSDKGAIAFIGSAGLAIINTQPSQVSSSASTTSASNGTQTGITGAFGLMGSVGTTNIQFGLIVGWDWLGKNSSYLYEGKPWLAFDVGYNFLQ